MKDELLLATQEFIRSWVTFIVNERKGNTPETLDKALTAALKTLKHDIIYYVMEAQEEVTVNKQLN